MKVRVAVYDRDGRKLSETGDLECAPPPHSWGGGACEFPELAVPAGGSIIVGLVQADGCMISRMNPTNRFAKFPDTYGGGWPALSGALPSGVRITKDSTITGLSTASSIVRNEMSKAINAERERDGATQMSGKHRAPEVTSVNTEDSSAHDVGVRDLVEAIVADRKLDAVWRRALDEAVVELQKMSRDLDGSSAAFAVTQRTLHRAEARLNALRDKGRPRDDR